MDGSLQSRAEELASEFAESATTIGELNQLMRLMMKSGLERMLDTEMDVHLGRKGSPPEGEPPAAASRPGPPNRRNGRSQKTLQGELGEIALETPRDREGTFEPKIVEKHQRRIPDFDEKLLALYAKGMTTRDIQEIVQQLYGVEVSAQLVSEVTADLDADVAAWRNRALEAVWPIVYFDGNDRYWELDSLGNWDKLRNGLTDTSTVLEDRAHNEANELTGFDSPGSYADPGAHDDAGNMTTIPSPKDLTNGLTATYDPWNRLVKLVDGASDVQTNRYDGLHRRIRKIDHTGASDVTTDYYYNEQWQCLLETVDGSPETMYLWAPHYVDALDAALGTHRRQRTAWIKARLRKTPSGSGGVPYSHVAVASERQWERKYRKHGKHFGLNGTATRASVRQFQLAVQRHINAPRTRLIRGTYRGQKADLFLDRHTQLLVIRRPNGSFVSGWRLSSQQLKHVLSSATLGGS